MLKFPAWLCVLSIWSAIHTRLRCDLPSVLFHTFTWDNLSLCFTQIYKANPKDYTQLDEFAPNMPSRFLIVDLPGIIVRKCLQTWEIKQINNKCHHTDCAGQMRCCCLEKLKNTLFKILKNRPRYYISFLIGCNVQSLPVVALVVQVTTNTQKLNKNYFKGEGEHF